MRENRTPGSVRGRFSNEPSYRNKMDRIKDKLVSIPDSVNSVKTPHFSVRRRIQRKDAKPQRSPASLGIYAGQAEKVVEVARDGQSVAEKMAGFGHRAPPGSQFWQELEGNKAEMAILGVFFEVARYVLSLHP